MKGHLITPGYWNSPEERAGQIRDGRPCTGEIAVRDKEARLKKF